MPQSNPPTSLGNKILPVAAVIAVVLIAAAVRCSSTEDVGSGPNVGALSVKTKVSPAEGVSRVNYRVTGNDIAAVSGSNTMTGDTASFLIKDIPAGSGYTITLTARSADGNTRCNQTASFDVVAERITSANLDLPCVHTGSFRTGAPGDPDASKVSEAEPTPDCAACEQENIKSGKCEPKSGCDGLEGVDKTLCLDLLACARRTSCWLKRPVDCLCGDAEDVACAKGEANGDCRREIQAATKTNDPLMNGTRFFNLDFPAGRALNMVSCDHENCQSVCATK